MQGLFGCSRPSSLFMGKHTKTYLLAVVSIVLFVGFSLLLFVYTDPDQIVQWVGVDNAYLLIFVVAIAGGFTTLNIIPYHLLLISLALAGLNPFLLGFLAATGVTLGDTTSYFVGYQGRKLLPEGATKWFDRIHRASGDNPRLFMLLCFLYSTFMPTSNDLLTIPAGIARIPFWRIMLPLLFGNIIFDTTLAYMSTHATELVQKLFL